MGIEVSVTELRRGYQLPPRVYRRLGIVHSNATRPGRSPDLFRTGLVQTGLVRWTKAVLELALVEILPPDGLTCVTLFAGSAGGVPAGVPRLRTYFRCALGLQLLGVKDAIAIEAAVGQRLESSLNVSAALRYRCSPMKRSDLLPSARNLHIVPVRLMEPGCTFPATRNRSNRRRSPFCAAL